MLATAPGCIIIADDDTAPDTNPPPNNDPARIGIDEGATMSADPGLGVGVFIEYAGAGRWSFWSTCDTENSGSTCEFDVFIKGANIDVIDDVDLEGADYAVDDVDDIHAFFDTDYDVDGVTVVGGEDASFQVEVWLDGAPNSDYVFWVLDGEIYQGMPTNPTIFVPQPTSDPPPPIDQVGIDEGATLSVNPGAGVGVYPEYLGEGRWNFWSTCDTETSALACDFDLYISGSNLIVTDQIDLESPDYAELTKDGVHAYYNTDYDIDGISVATDVGAPITLEVWLDGKPSSEYVFWVDGGDLYQGMPANPSTFVPNAL